MKLAVYAAVSFVAAMVMLVPAVNPDLNTPAIATLREAKGRVASVDANKHGVHFRLSGRPETFEYPTNAGPQALVDAALNAAGHREVVVLFEPEEPRRPVYNSVSYYAVWQISINGKSVRSYEETRQGYRSQNVWVRCICGGLFLFALYSAMVAKEARRVGYSW